MLNFLWGMASAGYLVAALFFFRFWRRAKDLLFFYFGIAFVIFALEQIASLCFGESYNDKILLFMLRLAGFVLLLVAIGLKNVSRSKL